MFDADESGTFEVVPEETPRPVWWLLWMAGLLAVVAALTLLMSL